MPSSPVWRMLALAALSLPWLSGCVIFEQAPAELSCNPALTGHWQPAHPDSVDAPYPLTKLPMDMRVEVDTQCRVSVTEPNRTSPPASTALGFELDGQHYLALSPHDITQALAADTPLLANTPLPHTAVILIKYRINGDTLELALPKAQLLGQRMQQGQLPNLRNAGPVFYLWQGNASSIRKALVEDHTVFEPFGLASNMYFHRINTGETP